MPRLMAMIRPRLAAARQCGAQRHGHVVERGDRSVGEGQPHRRDPVGGQDQEFEAVAVEAAGDDPFDAAHAVGADAADEFAHVAVLQVVQDARRYPPQRVGPGGAVLLNRDARPAAAGELDGPEGHHAGGDPGLAVPVRRSAENGDPAGSDTRTGSWLAASWRASGDPAAGSRSGLPSRVDRTGTGPAAAWPPGALATLTLAVAARASAVRASS